MSIKIIQAGPASIEATLRDYNEQWRAAYPDTGALSLVASGHPLTRQLGAKKPKPKPPKKPRPY